MTSASTYTYEIGYNPVMGVVTRARGRKKGVQGFLSVDPLARKYPAISPYAFVGNMPIRAIDPDGRDYVLIIDHKAKTVTVKSVFYVSSSDQLATSAANQAAARWNSNSGNFTYETGSRKASQQYTVNFDVQVQAVSDPYISQGAADMKSKGKNFSNVFELRPDSDPMFAPVVDKETGNTTTKNGVTKAGNLVIVKNSRATTETSDHEMGHSMGAKHTSTGLMTADSGDSRRSNSVSNKAVSSMLKNAFKRKRTSRLGRGSIKETGTAPEKFRKGKVR